MKEVVILSGKGGTGKTSFTASFSLLGGRDVVTADCDVDAPDMHLLLQPDFRYKNDFYSGEYSVILQEDCIQCGKCKNICRFDAIKLKNCQYQIDPLACEGCGYCSKVCPTETIINVPDMCGKWYRSNVKTGSFMVHAELKPGGENSGKLVAKVKNEAREIAMANKVQYILVDGSPGIGCPVISSLSGVNLVVFITEPTLSGLHDLERIYELVNKFKIPSCCIINKWDINPRITDQIVEFLQENNIPHIANIKYHGSFMAALSKGITVVEETNGELQEQMVDCWEKIKELSTKKNQSENSIYIKR